MTIRVTAWGHATEPDVEVTVPKMTDELRAQLWHYPCLDIQHLEPISLKALKKAMEDGDSL